jgi:hypothetical protein
MCHVFERMIHLAWFDIDLAPLQERSINQSGFFTVEPSVKISLNGAGSSAPDTTLDSFYTD